MQYMSPIYIEAYPCIEKIALGLGAPHSKHIAENPGEVLSTHHAEISLKKTGPLPKMSAGTLSGRVSLTLAVHAVL